MVRMTHILHAFTIFKILVVQLQHLFSFNIVGRIVTLLPRYSLLILCDTLVDSRKFL